MKKENRDDNFVDVLYSSSTKTVARTMCGPSLTRTWRHYPSHRFDSGGICKLSETRGITTEPDVVIAGMIRYSNCMNKRKRMIDIPRVMFGISTACLPRQRLDLYCTTRRVLYTRMSRCLWRENLLLCRSDILGTMCVTLLLVCLLALWEEKVR